MSGAVVKLFVGDIVVYVGQHSPWRVFGVDTAKRTVSIELVRDAKHLRYGVPVERLRLAELPSSIAEVRKGWAYGD